MPIAVTPSKSSLIRAYAEAHPGLREWQIAKALGGGVMTADVVKALRGDPKRRVKSVAPGAAG